MGFGFHVGARGTIRLVILLFWLGMFLPWMGAEGELPLFVEENRLIKGGAEDALPSVWLDLVEKLRGGGERLIDFRERRFFPALETTASLAGRIRYAPRDGISLEYSDPEYRVLVFDERGVLERGSDSRDRELPARRARLVEPFSRFLLHFFRGDTVNIHNDFSLYFLNGEEGWRLGVRPTDWRVERYLNSIVLEGTGDSPDRILIVLTDGNRQEITFFNDLEKPFTEEERNTFFR